MPENNDLTPAHSDSIGDTQGELDFEGVEILEAHAALPVDVDSALRQTIDDMLNRGDYVAAPDSRRGASWERLHYTTGMENPRARIGANPARRLNLVGAIARFVWMVGASDRLEDIAYYEEQVRPYTDNEISVPGSSYGRRIFESDAGLNQIDGAVQRLRKDPDSRQSAVVVWAPHDAVRDSNDIPCTFGFFYHVRQGELVASTIMRSNNACILLPYNFFEFSLLAEVVSAAVGVPFGRYVHWAASMHVYEGGQQALAQAVLDGPETASLEMPPVPMSSSETPEDDPNYPLEQVRRLAALEPRLRNASTTDEFAKVVEISQNAEGSMWLNDYWRSLFNVLAAWSAAKRAWWDAADERMGSLPEYLQGARFTIEGKNPRPSTETVEEPDSGVLPIPLTEDLAVMGAGFRSIHASGTEGTEISTFQAEVEAACRQWESAHNELMTLAEMQHVRQSAQDAYDLAARSQRRADGGNASDREPLGDDAITEAVEAFRAESA